MRRSEIGPRGIGERGIGARSTRSESRRVAGWPRVGVSLLATSQKTGSFIFYKLRRV